MNRATYCDVLLAGANMAAGLMRIDSAALGGGFENVEVAKSLLAGHGFANPFLAAATGPTAHVAPLYPYLLYLEMRVFRDAGLFGGVATLVTMAIDTAALLLLPRLARHLSGSALPGYLAAGLMVLVTAPAPQMDMELTALLAILVLLAICRERAAAAGILLGAIALTNPAVCPALVLAMGKRFRMRKAAAVVAIAAAMCAPWMIRNRAALGEWVPVRDNFGLEAWLSNGDGVTAGMGANDVFVRHHPMFDKLTATRIRELGEGEFNRRAFGAAVDWARRNPARFAGLTAERIGLYWFPAGLPAVWLITILSLVGLAVAPRRAVWTLAPFLVIYPLPYYVIQAHARYRYPVLWVSALFAAYAVCRFLPKMQYHLDGR